MMKSELKKLAICLILLGLACTAWGANATGSPGDTAAGTTVTALATRETIDYKDTYGTQMTQVVQATNETGTVTAEYGFDGPGTPPDISVTPGQVVYNYYYVTNEGNASDSNYTFKHQFDYGGDASGWVVELWESGSWVATLAAGSMHTQSGKTINDDATIPFYYKVIVSSEVAGAPNGSSITITTTIETSSTPNGSNSQPAYSAPNILDYGGAGTKKDIVSDQVIAPILTLTRASTTDAPTNYTGGIHDAVPGSVVTFTMTYSNTGGASAESIILVNKIPANTRLAHVNTAGTCIRVNITAAQGSAEGWTVYYNSVDDSLDPPKKDYGYYTNWTLIGTLETAGIEFPGENTTYSDGHPASGAKWIKWEKQYVDTVEDNKTLTWGVTIR